MQVQERVARLEGINEEVRETLRSMDNRIQAIDSRLWWMWGSLMLVSVGAIITIILRT